MKLGAALELSPASELFTDWRAGRRSLSGVFRVRSAAPLKLSGALSGRAVLVVEAPEIVLENIGAPDTEHDLITVVTAGGQVRVRGEVHAALIAEGKAEVEMEPGCRMQGSLLLAEGAARLSGQLAPDWNTAAGKTIGEALNAPGRGVYAVGISPAPLWRKGERQ